MSTLLHQVAGIAQRQLGVRERGTTNSGPEVDAYLAAVALPPGQPWCAAFVAWCWREAAGQLGVVNPWPMVGGCATLHEWADERGLLRPTPEPGDVFLHYSAKLRRMAHTGFVIRVAGAEFATIEGNTNTDGSRNGNGVYALRHRVSGGYRFIRSTELTAEPKPSGAAVAELPGGVMVPYVMQDGRAVAPLRPVVEALGATVDASAWPRLVVKR